MKKRLIFFITIFIFIISFILLIFIPFSNNSIEKYTTYYLDSILNPTNNNISSTENIENMIFETLKSSSLSCVLVEPESHKNTFFNNIQQGLSNVNYRITNISHNKNTATINICINYFNLDNIIQNGKAIFSNQYQNNYMSTDETIETIYNIIETEFNKGPLKEDTTTLTLILGFTIIFTLLGTLAGTFGQLIKDYQVIVQIISGAIIIIFGLNYIGAFKIYFLQKSFKLNFKVNNLRFFSSIIFGIIFAIGWTPCVGTFLSTALMIAVNSQNMLIGSLMLLIYSLGLGIPFIICAIFIDSMKKNLDILKKHYQIINKISGTILIIFGITIMTGQFNIILSFFTI